MPTISEEEIMRILGFQVGGPDLNYGRHDEHAHQCPACDHIWEHDRANIHTDAQNEEAHTCPKCRFAGDECYTKYRGPLPPKA